MTSAEDVSVYVKTSWQSIILIDCFLTEATSTLPERAHPFGQVLLPGQKDLWHTAGAAEGGETPRPPPNPYQELTWSCALGAGNGEQRWYVGLGHFSATAWRMSQESLIQGQWGVSGGIRAGGHRVRRYQGGRGSMRGWVLPGHYCCARPIPGWQTLTQALHEASPGAALTPSLWAPRISPRSLGGGCRPWGSGNSCCGGLQDCRPQCGHRHRHQHPGRGRGLPSSPEARVTAPRPVPLSLPAPTGTLRHSWLHGLLLCTRCSTSGCVCVPGVGAKA